MNLTKGWFAHQVLFLENISSKNPIKKHVPRAIESNFRFFTIRLFFVKHRYDFSNFFKINNNFNNVALVWFFLCRKYCIFTLRPSMSNFTLGPNQEQSKRGKRSMPDREGRTVKTQLSLLK